MSERSLRDYLLEAADDLEGIVKQILEFLLERDKKKLGEETMCDLAHIFDGKQQQVKEYLSKVEEYQRREELIRELEKCVENRNDVINKVEAELKAAEFALSAAAFQANKKVKSVWESEARPVNTEELVRFAHQISKSYAVAAPLFWQQGDPSRPFPTEPEFSNSHLNAPRPQSHVVHPMIPPLRQPPNVRTPPQPGVGGRMNVSPMTGPGGFPPGSMQRNWSPRGYGQPSSSPRGRGAPVSQSMSRGMMPNVSPFGGRRPSTNASPQITSPTVNFTSPTARPLPPVSSVEQMSSDSSSSSSSEDESPR